MTFKENTGMWWHNVATADNLMEIVKVTQFSGPRCDYWDYLATWVDVQIMNHQLTRESVNCYRRVI